jgi:hypothetical protein
MTPPATFTITVGDEGVLTVDEIWPDGDAPENPTVDDVIAVVRKSGSGRTFASDWGFSLHVEVNGKDCGIS